MSYYMVYPTNREALSYQEFLSDALRKHHSPLYKPAPVVFEVVEEGRNLFTMNSSTSSRKYEVESLSIGDYVSFHSEVSTYHGIRHYE